MSTVPAQNLELSSSSKIRRTVSLPMVVIDPTLIKTTAENNKSNKSPIGEQFGFRTPNKIDVDPIPLPVFTPEEIPECWDKNIAAGKVDLKSTTRELITPNPKIMKSQEEIEKWFYKNYHHLDHPAAYVGHEGNTDDPKLWDKADLRVLVVRLSTYDSVNGSVTHGAIAQMSRQAGREGKFNIYVDHAYMPSGRSDCAYMREELVPWWFGRSSKRPPTEFDVILISNALTLEVWNSIPGLLYSGIPPFKTMRNLDLPIGHKDAYPILIMGGVVVDFLECLYGKVDGEECVMDVTLIGDGEYILPRTLKLLNKCKQEGKTAREFLKEGHAISEDDDFERDSNPKQGKYSWWYEPDLYEHIYDETPDPKTGYKELRKIIRRPGNEHAPAPGLIKRAVVRDLNKTAVWAEVPLQYEGSLGDSVDIQISSGCLCIADDDKAPLAVPSYIETDMGFERIKDLYARLQDPEEVGGVLIQTRKALQGADRVVFTGRKNVRTYTFRDESGEHEHRLTCTDEHKFDTAAFGDAEPNWTPASKLGIGQEIHSVLPEAYAKARDLAGKVNDNAQHYYGQTTVLELYEISEYFEADCYDIEKCDISEYIVNGLIVHNSGGLCSFCLAEGTPVTVRGKEVPVESLEDFTWDGDPDDREMDTPYGLQVPDGVQFTGDRECIKITTSSGRSLVCTLDHEILTHRDGKVLKVKAGELVADKDVMLSTSHVTQHKPGRDSGQRDFLYPAMTGSREQQRDHKKVLEKVSAAATKAKENAEQAVMEFSDNLDKEQKVQQEWLMKLRKANVYDEKITSIENVGIKKVYDVWNIPRGHVFYANGFVVGNCHEAHTQGRWRERSLDVIKECAEQAVRQQGAQMASFYSLTWSLHSQIYSLLLWSYSRFGNTNLISQRADQASADPEFFKYQNAQGENHATVGVEGCSQRMRNYFNKSLHTEQFIRMCHNAAWAGHGSLKLFMILSGLETPADIEEFCQLMRDLRRDFLDIAKQRSKQLGKECNPVRLNPSFMLLLNAPHTALQWAPCSSAYDLKNQTLAPVVQTTRECGFGFRTALTRDRVRHSQVSTMFGREATRYLVEAGLRTYYVNYGPVDECCVWILDQEMRKDGYDWLYYFREKTWEHVFPSDAILTPMRRDYLWNQWLKIREYIGISYCLRTSVNPNPKCHDCGACGAADDRRFMLTREIENSSRLKGQEASRRDMTIRKKVRWLLNVYDPTKRTCLKDILSREVVRAMMLSSSKPVEEGGIGFYNDLVHSYLNIAGHSLKHAEGMNNLPWVGGRILIDMSFNKAWSDDLLRGLIPAINEHLWGMRIEDFTASDRLVPLDGRCFALYSVELPIPMLDLQNSMEKFDESESIKYKQKVNIAKDVMRTEMVVKPRSETVPMALLEPTPRPGYNRLTFLGSLTANPMQLLITLTGKPPRVIRPNPIKCLGIFQPQESTEDDIFAIMEGREVNCKITGQPIELDVFTGERYRSQSAPDLCLAADLKDVLRMQSHGVEVNVHAMTHK